MALVMSSSPARGVGNNPSWLSPSVAFDPPPVPLSVVLSELSYNRDLSHPEDFEQELAQKHAQAVQQAQQDEGLSAPAGSRARLRAEARAEARAENTALHTPALTP